MSEICKDELDNDCDGAADEGCNCAHDKCTAGPAMNNGCDPCVTMVCAADPSCCGNAWSAACVEKVRTVCGSLACDESQGNCAHTLCETGNQSTPLAQGCDNQQAGCVTQICAIDSYCCTTDWDSICVGQVSKVCGLNCG